MKPTGITLQPGQTLRNRYEIKGLLGAGGMGAVYRAYDHFRQRELALKQLHEHLTPDTTTRLLRELSLQEQIEHTGVVRTYDADQDPDTSAIFFTMALVEGPSLEDLLQATRALAPCEPFSLAQIERLLTRLTAILDAVHQKGILHGDIKPSHVLFGQTKATGTFAQGPLNRAQIDAWLDAPMYLIDFGLARPLTFSMLPTGGAGTPPVMAPEQWHTDAPLTPATDVYATGLLLYRLLTGAPHTGGQLPPPSAWLRAHGQPGRPEPLSSALDAIVARSIAYLPEERYPHATDLCADVVSAISPPASEEASAPETDDISLPKGHEQNAKASALQSAPHRNASPRAAVSFDKHVKTLDLSGEEIHLQNLEALAGCAQIRHLALNHSGLRDSALIYLSPLDTLETLQCTDNALTGEGLRHIAQLPALRMLSLSHNPLRPGALRALQATQTLRWLSLWGCPVTADDIDALSHLRQLETLCLSETKIDDRAHRALSQMTRLQTLELHHTQLTQQGFAQLRASLPDCRIYGAPAHNIAAA